MAFKRLYARSEIRNLASPSTNSRVTMLKPCLSFNRKGLFFWVGGPRAELSRSRSHGNCSNAGAKWGCSSPSTRRRRILVWTRLLRDRATPGASSAICPAEFRMKESGKKPRGSSLRVFPVWRGRCQSRKFAGCRTERRPASTLSISMSTSPDLRRITSGLSSRTTIRFPITALLIDTKEIWWSMRQKCSLCSVRIMYDTFGAGSPRERRLF